jgi:hypothetical protein
MTFSPTSFLKRNNIVGCSDGAATLVLLGAGSIPERLAKGRHHRAGEAEPPRARTGGTRIESRGSLILVTSAPMSSTRFKRLNKIFDDIGPPQINLAVIPALNPIV